MVEGHKYLTVYVSSMTSQWNGKGKDPCELFSGGGYGKIGRCYGLIGLSPGMETY